MINLYCLKIKWVFPCRCNFVYDGLGNLYKKSCGQSEVQYIIDPFGNPGADVVGQVKHFQRFTVEHENKIITHDKINDINHWDRNDKKSPLRSVNTNVHVAATCRKDKIMQCLHKGGLVVGARGGGVAQWLGCWICSLEVLASNPPPCH